MQKFSYGAGECLEFVDRSPAAVAPHDQRAWQGLFAAYSLVEDPVGSRPAVNRPGVALFELDRRTLQVTSMELFY